jgi:redox-sensitive bicupin YhaK (pirin superfamily)
MIVDKNKEDIMKDLSSRRFFLWGLATLGLSSLVKGSTTPITNKDNMKGGVMLQVRKSEERGVGAHGWLNSFHTFSFANYYDPKFMGFRTLRVINEDRIDGGTGFGTHPHSDMEIISYVVKGALEHQDSMGTKAFIKPGEVQRMSAGSGVAHSEKNYFENDETHFFQIWIMPNKRGENPGYGQKSFETELNTKKMVLVVSESGRDGSISIKQDADMYISRLKGNETVDFTVRPQRGAWIQVVKGLVSVNGTEVKTGDGIAVDESGLLSFRAIGDSEFILFDLA